MNRRELLEGSIAVAAVAVLPGGIYPDLAYPAATGSGLYLARFVDMMNRSDLQMSFFDKGRVFVAKFDSGVELIASVSEKDDDGRLLWYYTKRYLEEFIES